MFWRGWFRKTDLPALDLKRLKGFESVLGYIFKNPELLKRALSHKSWVNEMRLGQDDHNERLEFLGDAVLELIISDLLFTHFPDEREGQMSKIRASLVNETSLATLARQLKLGDFLYLGKGEALCDGREKNSLIADAFEAVIGALYLDSGFGPVYRIVKKIFEPEIERAGREDISRDYKTKLQEEIQNRFKTAPEYRISTESGPDHDKTFEVELFIQDKLWSRGLGKSKKQAEQSAAEKALEKLDL